MTNLTNLTDLTNVTDLTGLTNVTDLELNGGYIVVISVMKGSYLVQLSRIPPIEKFVALPLDTS